MTDDLQKAGKRWRIARAVISILGTALCLLVCNIFLFVCILAVILSGTDSAFYAVTAGVLGISCILLARYFARGHVSRPWFIALGLAFTVLFLMGGPSFLRARKRSAATQVKEDLRLIDAAVEAPDYLTTNHADSVPPTRAEPTPFPAKPLTLENTQPETLPPSP